MPVETRFLQETGFLRSAVSPKPPVAKGGVGGVAAAAEFVSRSYTQGIVKRNARRETKPCFSPDVQGRLRVNSFHLTEFLDRETKRKSVKRLE